jgi:hypothetical protein
MRIRRLLFSLPVLLAAGLPVCAPASVSIAGGVFVQSDPSTAGAAAIVSSGASVPTVPLEVQGSLLVPLTHAGGYAATAEIRGFTGGGYGGAYVGAGAGIGTLSSDRSSGTVFTVFAGKSIATLTSVEIRLYKQLQDTGATAGFIGVRFSF